MDQKTTENTQASAGSKSGTRLNPCRNRCDSFLLKMDN